MCQRCEIGCVNAWRSHGIERRRGWWSPTPRSDKKNLRQVWLKKDRQSYLSQARLVIAAHIWFFPQRPSAQCSSCTEMVNSQRHCRSAICRVLWSSAESVPHDPQHSCDIQNLAWIIRRICFVTALAGKKVISTEARSSARWTIILPAKSSTPIPPRIPPSARKLPQRKQWLSGA